MIVAVILTIVFSVVKRKINEPENICTILGIVFFVLIVFNLISSIPQILTNNNKTAVSQEENDIAEKDLPETSRMYISFYLMNMRVLRILNTIMITIIRNFQIFLHRGDLIFHMEVITQSLFGHLQLYPIF